MKNKSTKTILITALVVVGAAAAYFMMNKDTNQGFTIENSAPVFKKEGELLFISKDNNETLAVIDIEIADTDQKTMQGLMYRSSMPQNAGMLFLMPREDIQGFWMRNTYIPLDMIFVNSNKQIVTIHANTPPMNESSYISTAPALYVVEVNAGYCNKNNIKEGDKIDFTINK